MVTSSESDIAPPPPPHHAACISFGLQMGQYFYFDLCTYNDTSIMAPSDQFPCGRVGNGNFLNAQSSQPHKCCKSLAVRLWCILFPPVFMLLALCWEPDPSSASIARSLLLFPQGAQSACAKLQYVTAYTQPATSSKPPWVESHSVVAGTSNSLRVVQQGYHSTNDPRFGCITQVSCCGRGPPVFFSHLIVAQWYYSCTVGGVCRDAL